MVTFLGHILTHRQCLRIIHIARETDERGDKELVTFLGQVLLCYIIHIAQEKDSHETETKVGHIFGANFATHAIVPCDTYCT